MFLYSSLRSQVLPFYQLSTNTSYNVIKAYISTALDSTGALRALSFLVTQKAAKGPPSAEKFASG